MFLIINKMIQFVILIHGSTWYSLLINILTPNHYLYNEILSRKVGVIDRNLSIAGREMSSN